MLPVVLSVWVTGDPLGVPGLKYAKDLRVQPNLIRSSSKQIIWGIRLLYSLEFVT